MEGAGESGFPPSAAWASEVRREPRGDPEAGGVGVGGPDSQPFVARASARFGEFRFVVTFL